MEYIIQSKLDKYKKSLKEVEYYSKAASRAVEKLKNAYNDLPDKIKESIK